MKRFPVSMTAQLMNIVYCTSVVSLSVQWFTVKNVFCLDRLFEQNKWLSSAEIPESTSVAAGTV